MDPGTHVQNKHYAVAIKVIDRVASNSQYAPGDSRLSPESKNRELLLADMRPMCYNPPAI